MDNQHGRLAARRRLRENERRNAKIAAMTEAELQEMCDDGVAYMEQHSTQLDAIATLNRSYVAQGKRQRARVELTAMVPTRTVTVARPRERRDGSTRHSTRGGPDDDDDHHLAGGHQGAIEQVCRGCYSAVALPNLPTCEECSLLTMSLHIARRMTGRAA